MYAAGQGQGSATIDANSIAVTSAKTMAAQVAQANGVFVDPAKDVKFGKRVTATAPGPFSGARRRITLSK